MLSDVDIFRIDFGYNGLILCCVCLLRESAEHFVPNFATKKMGQLFVSSQKRLIFADDYIRPYKGVNCI